jgi:flagellar biosynthesis protein FliR
MIVDHFLCSIERHQDIDRSIYLGLRGSRNVQRLIGGIHSPSFVTASYLWLEVFVGLEAAGFNTHMVVAALSHAGDVVSTSLGQGTFSIRKCHMV